MPITARRVTVGSVPAADPFAIRNTLNPEASIPVDGVNCGLIDASLLTDYNAPGTDAVTIPDGTDLTNTTVYGDVSFPSTMNLGITGQNVLFVGGTNIPATNSAVIKADQARSGSNVFITLKDFEIRPIRPSLNRDGIRGHHLRIHRPVIRDTVDGAGLYNPSGSDMDVRWYGGLIEDLPYFYPDYDNGTSGAAEHSDGTHNDCVQVHGGNNWILQGVYFNGTGYLSPYSTSAGPTPWLQSDGWSAGAGLIVTDDTGYSSTVATGLTYDGNGYASIAGGAAVLGCWARGGKSQFNVKANLAFTALRNKSFTEGPVHVGSPGTWNTYYWRYSPTSTGSGVYAPVTGMNPTGNSTVSNTTNVWWNGALSGLPLASGRANGVQFD